MAEVTIRNLDAEVIEIYRRNAEAHGCSLEAELRRVLVDQVIPDFRAILAEADRIAAATEGVPQTDSVELLREDRRR